MTETHALDRLFATIAARKAAGDATASYTAKLIVAGRGEMRQEIRRGSD